MDLGQLENLHEVDIWMRLLATVQHEGWCEDKHAPARLKQNLADLSKRRVVPAKTIQAIRDCFFGLPVRAALQSL